MSIASPFSPDSIAQAEPRLWVGRPVDASHVDRRLRTGRTVIVDIRSAPAFDGGHIPGSLNMPATGVLWALFGRLGLGEIGVTVVGHTAFDARSALRELAVPHGELLAGGFGEWRRRRLPVDRGLAIDAERAAGQLAQGGVALVDVRSPEEWLAAHVPGSINVSLSGWSQRHRALPRLPLLVAGPSDEASAMAASLFRAAGHGCVWRVEGGGIPALMASGAAATIR
jgi:hydroxyacylglutathione hydrolase